MSDATWYLGPLGDLRPLIVPEPDLNIDEVRYGGVHQGLSGARTMDVTGHRAEYKFEFKHLERDEFVWLEALHTRFVPGPFHLLNPLKRNRLTVQASRMLPIESKNSGVFLTAPYTFVRDWPTEIPLPGRSCRVAGWAGANAYLQFDQQKLVPLMPNETLTASVYLRSDLAHSGWLRVSWYDADRAFISNTDVPISLATEWQRHWSTFHEAPSDAVGAMFTLVLGSANTAVYVAAPQLEADAPFPTEWQIGGGAPVVLVDQLPTTSGRFPLRNASLNLLEA